MKLADVRKLKDRLLCKVAPEDEWWTPYGSKELAYDLDWGDAIFEYMNRLGVDYSNPAWKNLPWEDSPWMSLD